MKKPAPVVLIAGGGTGGHVFPGIAVAEAMEKLSGVRVVFAGTKKGLEARVVPGRGYELVTLDVSAMQGGGAARFLKGGLIAARATLSGLREIDRLQPRAILSVGGYAAGPISLAGVLRGTPLAIYEPNRAAGLTNRWLARFSKRMYVAWDETAAKWPAKARHFGIPLRAGFGPSGAPKGAELTLLVLGGSQGARRLNEYVPQAVASIRKGELGSFRVIHQAGRDRDEVVRAAYAAVGVPADVRTFIDDMPAALASADVVVTRAGATAVAELCSVGRAGVLVPFPFASDNHQVENARSLERLGGCICVEESEFTRGALERALRALLSDGEKRRQVSEHALAWNRNSAALDIAHDLLDLAGCMPAARSSESGNGKQTPLSEGN